MLARGIGMMRAMDQATMGLQPVARRRVRNITAIGGNAVTAGRDPYNYVIVSHKAAMP